jgi:hypothetical protein
MLGLDLTQEPRAIREAKEEEALAIVTRLLGRRLRVYTVNCVSAKI